MLAALGRSAVPISELAGRFTRYAPSGEINSRVADVSDSLDGIRTWAAERGAEVDTLEAASTGEMAALRGEILAVIRS